MAYFYIDQKKVQNAYAELNDMCQNLSTAKNAFEKVQNRILKKMPQMTGILENIKSALEWQVNMTNVYSETLEEIARSYETHENALLLEQISGKTDSQTETENSSSENSSSDTSSQDDSDSQFLSWWKSVLKWMDKTKYDDKAGIAGDGISYWESLCKFFTGDMKGLSGAEDWFDLSDKSIGLWNGFYEYLKDFYKSAGDMEIFSIANQKKVAGLGLGGDILGLISGLFGAADNISNTEGIGTAGIIGQLFGVGDDITGVWEGFEELKHVGDASSGGIYSPLKFYTTIVKGYTEAIGQGFTSYEKYAADGSWDLGDTAATGIESSVSGLYAMISSLSFGLISEGTTGVSASDISGALERGCTDIGIQAADYIKNDSSLYQMYQESGTAGRVFITFYAALRAS